MNEDWVFKRGDLYYANLNPYFGSEQGGTPVHYTLESVQELGQKSVVLLEQIKTIDKRRILSYIGKVSREEMRAVDEALQVSLDIHIPEEMEAP